MDNKNEFSYTYSAKDQEEIRMIREKYAEKDKEEDKMEKLRRLDKKVTQTAQIVSLIFGIVGTLILGFGMSMIMSELGRILGAHTYLATPIGIAIGVVGGIILCLAYPIYNIIVRRERKKIAPEIIRLTDELMK